MAETNEPQRRPPGRPKKSAAPVQRRKPSPSEQLANLLRRETVLQNRVEKAKSDLVDVQRQIESLWQERQQGSQHN